MSGDRDEPCYCLSTSSRNDPGPASLKMITKCTHPRAHIPTFFRSGEDQKSIRIHQKRVVYCARHILSLSFRHNFYPCRHQAIHMVLGPQIEQPTIHIIFRHEIICSDKKKIPTPFISATMPIKASRDRHRSNDIRPPQTKEPC